MTSLVAWSGVDTHGTASIYFASDSRISWGNNQIWDYGRKLFASSTQPDILGYYGDVLFPSQVLGQVTDLIDRKLLFNENNDPTTRFERISEIIQSSFEKLPVEQSRTFEIIYCTRSSYGMSSSFCIYVLGWNTKLKWSKEQLNLPVKSGLIRVFGSGQRAVNRWYERWNNTTEKGTSRSVFSAFCDALQSGEDAYTGGAPQLIGLYRIREGKTFGVIYKNERFLLGLPVNTSMRLDETEWRNALFERSDWATLDRLEDAQKHFSPRGLGLNFKK